MYACIYHPLDHVFRHLIASLLRFITCGFTHAHFHTIHQCSSCSAPSPTPRPRSQRQQSLLLWPSSSLVARGVSLTVPASFPSPVIRNWDLAIATRPSCTTASAYRWALQSTLRISMYCRQAMGLVDIPYLLPSPPSITPILSCLAPIP